MTENAQIAAGLAWASAGAWSLLSAYASVTDLRRGVIPRRAVWIVGMVIAVLLVAASIVLGDLGRVGWAFLGAGSIGAFLEIVYRLWPGRIGFGDVRLIIVNSLLAGWWGIEWSWWALCAGAVAELPIALVAVIRHGRQATVRWAPGLGLGTAAVVANRLLFIGAVG
ncbi:prepilin peptidase [Candidatus Poriferisodalis sp.]|uniref:prepilin peptidase n=1 Tax=Candidatus Poriferisodalis sp. TaxID=3101277 RepID=UPI003B52A9AC